MNPQEQVVAHLRQLGVDHEIVPCDPTLADTAAFCEAYGYSPDDSANTIIVVGKGEIPRPVACVGWRRPFSRSMVSARRWR